MLEILSRKRGVAAGAVVLLLLIFAAQMVVAVRGQSLTWDEDDHIFAGYMSWKTADFGLNPEHPPLVKLLATIPLLPLDLRVPKLQGRYFKEEAYLSGRDFLFGNAPQYSSETLVFRVRMAAMILTLLMAVLVFLAGQEMFGTGAGLLALLLLIFEPNIVAHGAYVTTDSGVSCFFFATIYAFYRFVKRPTLVRLLVAGLAGGLALASKHSAILLLPMIVLLIAGVLLLRRKSDSKPLANARQLVLGLCAIIVLACAVLWAFYGFRYNARPAGLALAPTLAEYTHPLKPTEAKGILLFGRLHLLPESYLYGLTDVRAMANGMPSFIFGKVYEHGVWYYFPFVFLIKSTIGFLGLFAISIYAICARRLNRWLEVLFLTVPPIFYLLIAMGSSLNIGARHILPMYVFFCVLIAGAAVALMRDSRAWRYVIAALVVLHIASSLRSYPNDMAYANELWGGPTKTYHYLTDSNTDWGQQLLAVKRYTDQHGIKQCWFAYFVQPFVRFEDYGIPCKPLPTFDSVSDNPEYEVPPVIEGPVFVSAGDLTGFEFGSNVLNPSKVFQKFHPVTSIQDGVLVYEGTFAVPLASAYSHMSESKKLLNAKQFDAAVAEAQTAVSIAPDEFMPQFQLGHVEAAAHHAAEARAAYERAMAIAQTMEPEAREDWSAQVRAKMAAVPE
jgi:4-amino-4-deoxy-L-arabinose transferase-like glycosyltransferase